MRGCSLLIVVAVIVGCSSGPTLPQCHPVAGELIYNNQPLAEAMIVFHPRGATDPNVPQPFAQTDAQGKFKITTFTTNDGAPAGDYAITVELRAAQQSGDEVARSGPNTLPPKYAEAQTSGLTFTVKPGKNEVPAIRLAN